MKRTVRLFGVVLGVLVVVGVAAIVSGLSKRGRAEIKTKPVNAQEAARRAFCLSALLSRARFEGVVAGMRRSQPDLVDVTVQSYTQQGDELNRWLKRELLWESLSRHEKALLEKPVGSWLERDRTDVSWRTESLGVIAWAIQKADAFPPYDQQADLKILLNVVPVLKPAAEFVSQARLRDETAIQKARDVAEFWHWRARSYQISKDAKQYPPPAGLTYDRIVAKSAERGEKDGLFKTIGADFPAFGKPYRNLNEEEWNVMRSIASERQYGLNWLCGYSTNWDDVPTDT